MKRKKREEKRILNEGRLVVDKMKNTKVNMEGKKGWKQKEKR